MIGHLHVRSAYTLLNSTLNIDRMMQLAKENNIQYLALTDKNVMHGAIDFYRKCNANNIKAIMGLEIDLFYNEQKFSLVLYAKDDIGFKSLLKISNDICANEKIMTIELLQKYDNHIIVATSGANDELHSYLLNEKEEELAFMLDVFKHSFNEFYVSIAMNDSGLLKIKNQTLKKVAHKLQIKTFALSRIYYGYPNEEEPYKVLCAIDQQKLLNDPTLEFSSKRFFRSSEQMRYLYDEEDLQTANDIAAMCNVKMAFEKVKLPIFNNKYGVDSKTFLRNLCKKGLEKRVGKNVPDEYVNRIAYELDIILKMGFEDYFLIVYDFIRFAKSKGIYVGPGRGSAAGSLVSYCLGITQIDPIEYHLLFERFLNPERISMPDIDIDFPDDRRQEVIDYVHDLYGNEHVAHIITFGTLKSRQVLRDVGRVLNIPIREIDLLAKMIPNAPKITLDFVYETNGVFKQTILSNKKYENLFSIAKVLEGLPRHASTHAAGVVLCREEISDICPLMKVEEDLLSTQYTMEYLEDLGLIKIDFLGLRNLTIIDEVSNIVRKTKNPSFDIMKIPLNDTKTFDLIQNVNTVGIFQLESEGMKNLIRKMKPKSFEEIAATIALFRPGPMENIPLYLANREHPESIDYLHPTLKVITEKTYGVMIYQEQIMQATQIMADFSLGKADILRKAVSKKKLDELKSLEDEFMKGALSKGYDRELASKVYQSILKFAGYGFNRSHSIAYGLVAYQLAYLKANYPLAFFMSLLNSVIGSEVKTSEYIFEAKKQNIMVQHPSVNLSSYDYVIEKGTLRYPLLGIKNVGIAGAKVVISERERNGKFTDYFDFIARISTHRISRKVIESLIDAGALDEFKIGRLSMKASLDDALRYASLVSVEEENQIKIDLNLVSKPAITSCRENEQVISLNEKNVLGFYLSAHPIAKLRSRYQDVSSLLEMKKKKGFVKFVAHVDRIKEHRTKNGDLMCFVSASDDTSKFDVVCMPNIYTLYKNILKKDHYLYIEGSIERQDSCLAKKIEWISLENDS